MALATRCPHCHTAFRVAQDQLKLRAGLVRCGACREIFNGVEHLLQPEAMQPPPAATQHQAPKRADAPPPAASQPAKRAATEPAPAAKPLVERAVESPPPQNPAHPELRPSLPPQPSSDDHASAPAVLSPASPRPAEPSADFADFSEFLQPAVPASPSAHHGKDKPKEEAVQESDPLKAVTLIQFDELPEDIAAETRPLDEPLSPDVPADLPPESPGIVEQSAPPPSARAKSLDELRPGYRPVSTPPDTSETYDASEDEPEFVRAGRRRQRWARISRITFSLGSVLLALALGLQGIYAFRNVLAATFPQAKPSLSALCAALKCTIELPMEIDQVTLESSELQSQPEHEGMLALNMLLRNHSQIVQAWPAIELTLNDAGDKPVSRRVLTPRDYLPKSIDPAKGFPRYSEQALTVFIDASQIKPEGYRLYIFYP